MDNKEINEFLIEMQNGSELAFEKLYTRSSRDVYFFILSIIKNEETAKDLMQDTYIKIRENAFRYKPGTNAKAWMLTTAKNLTLNYYNRNKRLNLNIDDDFKNSIPDDSNQFDKADTKMTIERALKILNNKERQVVTLYSLGYKHREIAKIVNKPLGTVLWIYNKSLKKMREYLKGGYNEK